MEIFLDCLPCALRQMLEASRIATKDIDLQEEIMKEALLILSKHKEYNCSPYMVRDMHSIVKKLTGIKDPYAGIKTRDINIALELFPYLLQFLEKKQYELYWALKIAATGNILDSAMFANHDIENILDEELNKAFAICDINCFSEKLQRAATILFIADNAGETVFDRVLTEQFSHLNIYYAVRSEPIINDATLEDAYASGIGSSVKIISSGCDAPGTLLNSCSGEFLELFGSADLVISKGQGNFEALSNCGREIFYLLKAKCPMIAQRLGVELFDYVFKYDSNS